MTNREPQTPEEALALMAKGKPTIQGAGSAGARAGLVLDKVVTFEASPATVMVNGFRLQIAADIFSRTGDADEAERAQGLVDLLGDTLYNKIKVASNCAGINNEADYLAQEVAYLLVSGTFDPKGATEKFRKDVDGQVGSESNQLIAKCLKATNLGQIMQACRAHEPSDGQIGVSNTDGLRWALLNHFSTKKL